MSDRQQSFAESGFDLHRKATRKERFLNEMNEVVPWENLVSLIAPHYPKPGKVGRQPRSLEMMLRIYFVQQWFDLSDPGTEEQINDSRAIRSFVGVDLGEERAPDETTILNFRRLLEKHSLAEDILKAINEHLAESGLKIQKGTIVDATIIHAPSSTKNADRKRDPQMHQTKKGNEWYFGMKGHIGVDSRTKIIHSVEVTSANVHDSKVMGELLHGEETRVFGDSAYASQKARIQEASPGAKDFTQKRAYKNRPLTKSELRANTFKASTRARVEHLFGVIKNVFGFQKVRYRGLEKNAHRFTVCAALANLHIHRKRLLAAA